MAFSSSLRLLPIIAMAVAILQNIHTSGALALIPSQMRLENRKIPYRCTRNSSPFAETSPSSGSHTALKALSSTDNSWSVQSILGREEARALLDGPEFLPSGDYGDRIVFGRQAAEKEYGESDELGVILADDPRLARTYAEFPLESLDILLDHAVQYLPSDIDLDGASMNMVDIGSGLGRIVLYSALTRCTNEAKWKVRGIEISPSLHKEALELAQTGINLGVFEENASSDENDKGDNQANSFCFHCGSATDQAGRRLLEDAHLIFSYSTAFKAKEFDPDVGALILDTEEWSLPLSEACPDGCVVVTTDRALNPNLGWKMVERIDVPNPEVLGTTGFIHVFEKGRKEA